MARGAEGAISIHRERLAYELVALLRRRGGRDVTGAGDANERKTSCTRFKVPQVLPVQPADKGLMLFHTGKTKQGLELVKQVELTDSAFLSPHRYLTAMYMSLRDYPDFLAESEKGAEISHDEVLKETSAAARKGFEREGERGLIRDLYLAQRKFHEEGKLSATYLAITCAQSGRKREALQLLREDYEKQSAVFLMFRQNPDLLMLKNEAEYQELWSKVHPPAP